MPGTVGSWKFQDKPIHEANFALAEAYLDMAWQSCKALKKIKKYDWTHGMSIESLHYHAIELFLKGAILKKAPTERIATHNINTLKERFKAHYPDLKITEAFQIINLAPPTDDAAKIEIEARYNKMDQTLRYMTDASGVLWDGIYAFNRKGYRKILLRDKAWMRTTIVTILAQP